MLQFPNLRETLKLSLFLYELQVFRILSLFIRASQMQSKPRKAFQIISINELESPLVRYLSIFCFVISNQAA